ncbi:integrin alpha-PS2 isoform X1 [Neodiprion virginianus]|uniref:integrin alpha-PS2 isoform X1 n=1 Tax=Neodiprion virginianus TaxID=2961670 RepID=UPI001EE6A7EE|nr:integrin alpha-PS2 isoform X1 [Neodiprion virginianus]
MQIHVVMLFCAFTSITIPWTNGFNVETKHCTIYNWAENSMFGFAVSEQVDRYNRGWVIVGAPAAQTRQEGVEKGGAVYTCHFATDNNCSQINFDPEGNMWNAKIGAAYQVDNKTAQWFGATVSTTDEVDGPILACAPRYLWFTSSFAAREPVGTCYITSHSFSGSKEFSPCRTRLTGYHRQGSCQAGLGAALSKDGKRAFIGAPGSYYWQGQVYSIASEAEFEYLPPGRGFFGSAGQVFSSGSGGEPPVSFTKESGPEDDDSYLGYSVASGDFEGNGKQGAAVGMPRSYNLHGKVVLLRSDMTTWHANLTGDQMGAYFGYSVIACDVNGDGLDDLVVGAPMFTIEDDPKMTYETGRVHIFYQGMVEDPVQKFSESETRDGVENRGRFGLSLASLKDIDLDGYQDFAVGAPYGGPDGRGAVYIYHGSKTGVLEKYSQAIYASVMERPVSTFGFSIAGGKDLDDNYYPDIVIGAYESSSAAFFRSRPVIKIEAYVEFISQSKSVSLENRECTLSDRTTVSCLMLSACLKYTGRGVAPIFRFNVEYVLDTKKPNNPRLFFIEHESRSSINQSFELSSNNLLCKNFSVYVSPNIRDKLTSIDAEMRISLVEQQTFAEERRNPLAELRPVLGASTSQPDSISIMKSCGQDNVCIPNLELYATKSVEKYLLGSGNRFELDIVVQNTGEDAFEATYYLQLPKAIDYIKVEQIDKNEILVLCSAPNLKNNNTLKCEIGNPMPSEKLVHFKVILQPITTQDMKLSYDLDMTVNTTNPEDDGTRADNTVRLTMPIWVQTELFIEGKSKPKDLYFNFENYTSENITTELEFGPLLTHNYTIRNDGPSQILEGEAFLIWPAQTLAGEELIYLLEQPETSGRIECATANANYLSLTLDDKRRRQSYAGMVGGYSSGGSFDRTNQVTVDERRWQQNEGQTDDDLLVVKNSQTQTSGGYSKSHTASENYKVESGGQNNFAVEDRSFNGGGSQSTGVFTGSNEGSTQIHGTRFEEPMEPGMERGQKYKSETTYSETRGSGNNKNFAIGGDSVTGGGSQSMEIFTGSNGGATQIQGTRFKDSVEPGIENRNQFGDITYAETRHSTRRNHSGGFQHGWNDMRGTEEKVSGTNVNRDGYFRTGIYDSGNRGQVETEETINLNNGQEYSPTYKDRSEHSRGGENSERENFSGASGRVITENGEQRQWGSSRIPNVAASQELEKFFSNINRESTAIATNTRNGMEYVQLESRFRVANGKAYIQFKNGEVFELLDSRGSPSYTSSQEQDSRWQSREGRLEGGTDGLVYVVLADGRKFRIPGTYTYQRKETITIGGGVPQESVSGNWAYGRQITHTGESAGNGGGFGAEGNAWRQESSYESTYDSGRKVVSGTRRVGFEDQGEFSDDNVPATRTDERIRSRYRRETDDLNIAEFRKFEHRRTGRNRRADEPELKAENIEEGRVQMCKTAKCVNLRCTIGPLLKNEEVWIAMRSRIKAKTLKEIAFNDKVELSTQLVARVTRQPFIGDLAKPIDKSYEIFTTVYPSASPSAPDVIPLWIVVLSACAGAIILLLLIFLLYKCGFFKRNRPTDAAERQPLRNGNYDQ